MRMKEFKTLYKLKTEQATSSTFIASQRKSHGAAASNKLKAVFPRKTTVISFDREFVDRVAAGDQNCRKPTVERAVSPSGGSPKTQEPREANHASPRQDTGRNVSSSQAASPFKAMSPKRIEFTEPLEPRQ